MVEAYVDGHPNKLCVILGDRTIVKDAMYPHTNNEAEYLAVLLAVRLGATVVHSDSQLALKQLNGECKIKKPELQYLASEVFKAAKGKRVEFVWVSSDENPAGKELERGKS